MGTPIVLLIQSIYVLTRKNHASLPSFCFSSPQIFRGDFTYPSSIAICVYSKTRRAALNYPFPCQRPTLRKEKFKFSKTCISPLSFQNIYPKKKLLLKKQREFSKKRFWYFFYQTFIFCHAFSLTKEFQKKTLRTKGDFKLCSKYGWAGRSYFTAFYQFTGAY